MTDQEFDRILQKKMKEIQPLVASDNHISQIIQNLQNEQIYTRLEVFRYATYGLFFVCGVVCCWGIQKWMTPEVESPKVVFYSSQSNSQRNADVSVSDSLENYEIKLWNHSQNKSSSIVTDITNKSYKERIALNLHAEDEKSRSALLAELTSEVDTSSVPTFSEAQDNFSDKRNIVEPSQSVRTELVINTLPALESGALSSYEFSHWRITQKEIPGVVSLWKIVGGFTVGAGHELISSGLLLSIGWKNHFAFMSGIRRSTGLTRHFRSGDDFRNNYTDGSVILDDPSLPSTSEIGHLRHQHTEWVFPMYLQYRVRLFGGFSAFANSGIEIGFNETHMLKYRLLGREDDQFFSSVQNSNEVKWIAGAGVMWEKGRSSWQMLPMGRGRFYNQGNSRHQTMDFEVQLRGFYQF